jgi:hypothetical protein
MFPPTQVRKPLAFSIWPTRLTVVVLPLEPVMPTMGAWHSSVNSLVSLLMGMPLRRASATIGVSSGTPGLRKRTSVWSKICQE